VVAALLRRWLPACPIGGVMLGAFLVYVVYGVYRDHAHRLDVAVVPRRTRHRG